MAKRTYYRVGLKTLSALSIGGADSSVTDIDVVLDSKGQPVIPATSLCGALRGHLDEADARKVFGDLDEGESPVRVYDATLVGGNGTVSIRDSVSLESRVAAPGLKFDREVVERGTEFVTLIEIVDESGWTRETVESLLRALHAGEICFGGKRTRGMGRVEIESCKRAFFDFASPVDREAWLDFDPFDEASWAKYANATDIKTVITAAASFADMALLTLTLELVGGISVREYTTEPESYDYSQMVVHGELTEGTKEEVPLVPGTTWAGAFRDRFELLSSKELADDLFGTVSGDAPHASRITFGESAIEGGKWKVYTRNAIDRFTGGTIPGALYTQRSYYGGTTKLEIGLRGVGALTVNDVMPLIATLADLHNGFLSVGGLASVGLGLFRIAGVALTVKGSDRSEDFKAALLKDSGVDSLIAPDLTEAAKILVTTSTGGEA